jgi:hypothetical protein
VERLIASWAQSSSVVSQGFEGDMAAGAAGVGAAGEATQGGLEKDYCLIDRDYRPCVNEHEERFTNQAKTVIIYQMGLLLSVTSFKFYAARDKFSSYQTLKRLKAIGV